MKLGANNMKKLFLISTAMLILSGCGMKGSTVNTSTNGNTLANDSNISTVNVNGDNGLVAEAFKMAGENAQNKEKINKLEVKDVIHDNKELRITHHDQEQDKKINFNTKYTEKVSIPADRKLILKQFEKWEKDKEDIRKPDITEINRWCGDSFFISIFKEACNKYNAEYRYKINKYLKIKE